MSKYKTLKAHSQLQLRELIGDHIELGYRLYKEPYRAWWSNDETAWRCKMEVPKSQLEIRTERGGWK